MLPSLDNFLSYGSDVIKATPDYKRMLVDIYQTSITSEHLGENDKVNGSKLAESVLLNLRGHVDEVRPLPFLIHQDLTCQLSPSSCRRSSPPPSASSTKPAPLLYVWRTSKS